MFSFRSLALTLSSMALLWNLESCTQPISPEPTEKPDTIKSYVRAIVTTPDMTNQLWEVRVPDTLSKGVVGFTAYSGTQGTRYITPTFSVIECLHNLNPNGQEIIITIWYPHDLRIEPLVAGNENYLDSLRTWKEDRLEFIFPAPTTITTPYSQMKPRAFGWVRHVVTERYMPTNSNHWAIQTLWSTNYGVSYNAFSRLFSDQATIQASSLIIERYDTEKKRISGRFSFRAVGSVNGEKVEIRDGIFDNVKLVVENR
jgi:hypothetical protein